MVPPVAGALGLKLREERAGAGEVFLTFDDGPHPQGTPAVLEQLREAGAEATFFLAGEQVARRPALAAEIVAAGHRVELHCHRHRNQLRLTPRALLEDAERARAAIEEASGQQVRDYRPPYGIFSGAGLRAIRRRGWRPVLWSQWGRDWDRRATRRVDHPEAHRRRRPPVTSSSCTTPTTTALAAPGCAPWRRCRRSSRSSRRAGSRSSLLRR